jgi:hypothetical protein
MAISPVSGAALRGGDESEASPAQCGGPCRCQRLGGAVAATVDCLITLVVGRNA